MTADILADLDATARRPKGQPCAIAIMRRDRPELVEQWTRVLEAKQTGRTKASDADIAAWFIARDFAMTRATVERHRRNDPCTWCVPGREVTA